MNYSPEHLWYKLAFMHKTDMYTTKLNFSLHTCAETGLLQIEFGLCKSFNQMKLKGNQISLGGANMYNLR